MPPTAKARGFRHILCPVDFSKHARAALRYASVIAEQSGAALTVLVVNDPMLAAAAAAATRDAWRLDATTTTELRRFVHRAIGLVGAKATLEVVIGHPADEIGRVAQRLGVDLVVMGTHGLSGPKKWFFGSTTESLFRVSRVPVLAVPAWGRIASRQLDAFPGPTILAPVELEGTARAEVRRVMDAVQNFGAKPLFLHVVKPAQAPPWLVNDAGRLDRQRLDSAKQRLDQLIGALGRTRSRVVIGDPVQQIEKLAVKEKAAVIAMTLKRHGPLGPRRGSIAYRVVCSGIAAVLALPPPG